MEVFLCGRSLYLPQEVLFIIMKELCDTDRASDRESAMQKISNTQAARLTCRALESVASPFLIRSLWVSAGAWDCERLMAVATHSLFQKYVVELKYDCRVYNETMYARYEDFIRSKLWLPSPNPKDITPHTMDFSDEGLGRGRCIYESDRDRTLTMLDVEQCYEQVAVDDLSYLEHLRPQLMGVGTSYAVPEDSLTICWALKLMPNIRKISMNDRRFEEAPTRSSRFIERDKAMFKRDHDLYRISVGAQIPSYGKAAASSDRTILLHPRPLARRTFEMSQTDPHGHIRSTGRPATTRRPAELLANAADCQRSFQVLTHAIMISRPKAFEELDIEIPVVVLRIQERALDWMRYAFSCLRVLKMAIIPDCNETDGHVRTDKVLSKTYLRDILRASQNILELSLEIMPYRSDVRTHPLITALEGTTLPRLRKFSVHNGIRYKGSYDEVRVTILDFLRRHSSTLQCLSLHGLDNIVHPSDYSNGVFPYPDFIRQLGETGLNLNELDLLPQHDCKIGFHSQSENRIKEFFEVGGRCFSSPNKY